jgi:hypothetical protein
MWITGLLISQRSEAGEVQAFDKLASLQASVQFEASVFKFEVLF